METASFSFLVGDVSSGKTTLIEGLLCDILEDGKIQPAGFYQTGHYVGEQRDGYYLCIIKEDSIKKCSFAMIDRNAKRGTIPFVFDENCIEETFDVAKSMPLDGRPVLVFIDEFAQLELFGLGHRKSIETWAQRLLHTKAHFIITTNQRRMVKCRELLLSFGLQEAPFCHQMPKTSIEIKNDIYNILST